MAYNAFQLTDDMEAYSRLIERNAWGKQRTDGVQKANQETYLKLAVYNELAETPLKTEFVESWAMGNDKRWVKKSLPVVSKSYYRNVSLDEIREREE